MERVATILAVCFLLLGFAYDSGANPAAAAHRPGEATPAKKPAADPAADDGEYRRVFQIQYASADYLAEVVNEVYGSGETFLTPDQIYGFRRSGRPDLTAIADAGVMPGDSPFGVEAIAEDYSNSLIVKANDAEMAEIAGFIAQVDHPFKPDLYPVVIPLTYVRAEDMAPVVQSILDGTIVTGRAAEASREGVGNVSVDVETNSLVVVTDSDTLTTVESVLGQLDCASLYRDPSEDSGS